MSRILTSKEYLCYTNERLKNNEELDTGASHPGSSESFAMDHSVLGL